jgi:inner membrane protein
MNAAAHQLTAGACIGLFLADRRQRTGEAGTDPVVGGLAASIFTKLPDLLEPATSPSHRQFFHSVLFASLLGAVLYKLHHWLPEAPSEKFWKAAAMTAISAYLIHLALDATTVKSLPLVGKF